MEIIASAPSRKVGIQLDFIKPLEGHNLAVFTLTPEVNATKVGWVMTGPTPYISKLMQVFVSLDRMIGKDFAEGLANLKALLEKQGAAQAPGASSDRIFQNTRSS